MARGRIAFMALLPSMSFSRVALADWEYTKWGMTAEEVLAASPEKLIRTDQKTQDASRSFISDGRSSALLVGWHVASGRKFLALFYFDLETKRLVSVNLDLREMEKADDLQREVIGQYSDPAELSDVTTDFYSRIWKHEGDRIVFIRTPGTAKLNFFAD